jgi:hypothetical protein
VAKTQIENRFPLFAGDDHYPSGGLSDYRGSFASEDETRSYDWWQIAETRPNGSLEEIAAG